MAVKQGHENFCKGSKTFIKGLKGWFAAQRIAKKHDDEINRVVLPKSCTRKLHVILDSVQHTNMGKDLGHRSHFPKPRRGRRY